MNDERSPLLVAVIDAVADWLRLKRRRKFGRKCTQFDCVRMVVGGVGWSRRLLVVSAGVGLGLGAAFHYNNGQLSTVGLLRFGRAAVTVGRIAADYKITLHNVDPTTQRFQDLKSSVHTRSAEKLLQLCRANGGAFIKVGQHIGALEYLLPQEYVSTMKVLHSQAPQSPIEDVLQVIKEDLKKDPNNLFESFDEQPVGAASLAQVHRATLKDGSVVAVKVQHLRVKSHAFVDMKTMELLVRSVAWLFPEFKFVWLAEESKKNLPLELDFLLEGKNAERAQKMLAHHSWLKVPKIYWELSSDRILTMEYCSGGQINDVKYFQHHNIPVKQVTSNLGKLYSEMIFVHGYVHSDPHPGNILVENTSEGVRLVLLDHGLYANLTDDFRLHYANLWMSLLNADVQGIKKEAEALGVGPMYGMLACMLTARSWDAITVGIDRKKITAQEGDKIKEFAAAYMPVILDVLDQVPREMLLILKTNDLIRGIEYSLKAQTSSSSFITMSRCCTRAIMQERRQKCKTVLCSARLHLSEMWMQFKISIYFLYLLTLDCRLSRLFQTLKGSFAGLLYTA